jgi:hypothetical protein
LLCKRGDFAAPCRKNSAIVDRIARSDKVDRCAHDVRGLIGWTTLHCFRNNLRQGSWLALLALTINLALSFGHVHAIGGKAIGDKAAASDQIAQAAPGLSKAGAPAQGQNKGQDNDGHPDDLCPICMAAHAIGSAVAPTPPALPVRFAAATVVVERAAMPTRAELKRAAFQSRAPPNS